jgi:hypothetical protein
MSEPRQLPAKNLKHRLPSIRSLAMLKMEKNFIALEKGYPRQPYDDPRQSTGFLISRIEDELTELKQAWANADIQGVKEECADISNIVDYLFEQACRFEFCENERSCSNFKYQRGQEKVEKK